MKRLTVSLTLLAAGCLVMSGCGGGGDTPPTPPTAALYFPLAVGNQWSYQATDYTVAPATAAAHRRAFNRRTGLMRPAQVAADYVVSLVATATIENTTWFAASASFGDGTDSLRRYVRYDGTGILWKPDLDSAAYYRLKNPIVAGTTWDVPNDPARTFRIVAVGETTKVAVGTFANCLKVDDTITESGQPDDVLTSWFAPGVGLVREEERSGLTLIYSSELKQYHLAGQ